MSEKKNLVKKTLFFDEDDYVEIGNRANVLGMTSSKLIRQIIKEYILKPFLAEFEYKTINNTSETKTLLESASNEE